MIINILSFCESEYFFLFTFFFNVFLQLTSNSLFKFAWSRSTTWQILVSLRLDEYTLESFYSLSHASVERCLDSVEVIVKILAEAYQEREWLVQTVFQVSREESKRYNSVWIFNLCWLWEKSLNGLRELYIVIDYSRRILNITLAIWEFKQKDSSQCLICLIVKLQSKWYCYSILFGDNPVFLICSVG